MTPSLSIKYTETVEVSFNIYDVLSIVQYDLDKSGFPGILVYIKEYFLLLSTTIIFQVCLVIAFGIVSVNK